jgi:hypothetical protein
MCRIHPGRATSSQMNQSHAWVKARESGSCLSSAIQIITNWLGSNSKASRWYKTHFSFNKLFERISSFELMAEMDNMVSSCSGCSDPQIVAKMQYSVRVDGVLYEFKTCDSGSWKPSSGPMHFVRNSVCLRGPITHEMRDFPFGMYAPSSVAVVPRITDRLEGSSLAVFPDLHFLAFEFGCALTQIEVRAFYYSIIRSICIPHSVEIPFEECFMTCTTLSSLAFEFGSKLKEIQRKALWRCESLLSVCISASTDMIHSSDLARTKMSIVTFEEANRHFRVFRDFLVDFTGTSVVRYFGRGHDVTLSRDIEILGPSCFYDC